MEIGKKIAQPVQLPDLKPEEKPIPIQLPAPKPVEQPIPIELPKKVEVVK